MTNRHDAVTRRNRVAFCALVISLELAGLVGFLFLFAHFSHRTFWQGSYAIWPAVLFGVLGIGASGRAAWRSGPPDEE